MITTPGFGRCSECREQVLFALAVTGDVIAFDAAFEGGSFAIGWDITGTPRCRPLELSRSAREGECRYDRHVLACPALAPVIPLTRRVRRHPEPERRHASAR